jgi:hypothetical protein
MKSNTKSKIPGTNARPRKVGRPSFKPTDEQRDSVAAMTAYGIPQEEIARIIKNPETGKAIDDSTLRKHFADEIATGLTRANTKVAGSMFSMATEGDATSTKLGAASFWLARRSGWKETSRTEIAVRDVDPEELTDAELADIVGRRAQSRRRQRDAEAKEGEEQPTRLVR